MVGDRVGTQRLAYILFALVAWIGLTSAAFSLATGSTINAVISGLVGLIAIAAAIDGRVARTISERGLSSISLVVFAVIAVIIVLFEIRSFTTWDLVIDGEIRIPAVIRTIKSLGSFILAVALFVETLRIFRSPLRPS